MLTIQLSLKRVPAMSAAEVQAFARANPMRAARAVANVQYVQAEIEAHDAQRPWSSLPILRRYAH